MLWDSTSGTRIHGSFEAQGAVPASGRACPRPGESERRPGDSGRRTCFSVQPERRECAAKGWEVG